MEISKTSICAFIDHTNVKAEATTDAIKKLCDEAKEFGFHSVCVTPYRVKDARKFLDKKKEQVPDPLDFARGRQARDDNTNNPEIICVVGFPYGFTTTEEKVLEAKSAVSQGATEIDMVINIGAIKDGAWNYVKDDIVAVAKVIAPVGLKVIMEIGFLTKEELKKACHMAKEAGAAFVKTSTGYGPRTPTIQDIKIMREAVGDKMGVKASGGIHTFKQAKAMLEAGASRIGTSSGLEIIGVKTSKANNLSSE